MKAIERIYKYIDYKGINNSKLEKEIGLSNGYLGKMFSRKADIGESILNLILENSPEINPEWLLTGNGEMLKNKATLVETQDIIKGIPLITYDAIAGFSSMDNEGAFEKVLREF